MLRGQQGLLVGEQGLLLLLSLLRLLRRAGLGRTCDWPHLDGPGPRVPVCWPGRRLLPPPGATGRLLGGGGGVLVPPPPRLLRRLLEGFA